MQRTVDLLYKSKMDIQKSPNGNVSPLMKYLNSGASSSLSSRSPLSTLSKMASLNVDTFSPVFTLSKSNTSSSCSSNRSHLSAVDEEDVLVMDGIPIMRYSPTSSFSSNSLKTELCRSWEEFGMCRFGIKCQFAHGKEELRPTRLPTIKNKSEICKSFILGSCMYGSKCRFIHQVMTDSALVLTMQMEDHPMRDSVTKNPIASRTPRSQVTNTAVKPEHVSKTTILINKSVQNGATSTPRMNYWSPQDDGIEVTLPSRPGKASSREIVNEYIDSILCSHSTAARKRLPVFAEINLE